MAEDERASQVRHLLSNYVRVPTLRDLQSPIALSQLATQILSAVSERRSIWIKWTFEREALVKSALPCWIPVADLRDYLNAMEGPPLTSTDVAQRLRAFAEEPYEQYPDADLKAACLEVYAKEKAEGTELPAIIGVLQEFAEAEQERRRAEQSAAWRARVEESKAALEQRFLSGADCKWTPVTGSRELYCRINGRSYRLTQAPDKTWFLHRVSDVTRDEVALLGKYRHRGDANKVLAKAAYEPEPRW